MLLIESTNKNNTVKLALPIELHTCDYFSKKTTDLSFRLTVNKLLNYI